MNAFDPAHDPRMMTAKETAHFLNVSRTTIHRMSQRGDLTCYQVNARILRFNPTEVAGLLRPGSPSRK
jgi:excisionase family DNA binding protein